MADSKQIQNKLFKQACEEMKNKAAYFQSLQIESSSEEDNINEDLSLVEKTLSQYAEEDHNLKRVREFLQDLLTSGAITCLICIESVKQNEEVWSCSDCYCMLHLHCIQKWAKDSLYFKSSNDDESKKADMKWSCPKCRRDYLPHEKPTKYLCFCGKVENPACDSWTVPHSCGKHCMKYLQPNCGHTCILLCHPGPCPPCSQTVSKTCCCFKSKAVSRRCGNQDWLCNNKCEKQLQCETHFCNELCHRGPCPPCKKESKCKCKCGSNVAVRSCYDSLWQCDKQCNKPLICGNHLCQLICHEGLCPECPDSGPRLCPCGNTSVTLSCMKTVDPCGDTCNKFLECEMHKCTQRCHYGPCEKCLQMRTMKCRCGQKQKSVPCCKEFLCEIKCKLRRDCGRHNCNKKCCSGNCPPCEAICGRTLNCGNHKCTSLCHSGPCYPCREIIEVPCNCGATKISVPCGRKKSVIPPRCSYLCKLPPDCHHKNRHKHKCHFGTCPPCRLTCKKDLECGHICPAKCHSAVLTKIDKKKKKSGPWDLIDAYEYDLCCKPCPPCLIPIPTTCIGGHETINTPCHLSRPSSCGRSCGRVLQCGNHLCSFECHVVENSSDLTLSSSRCNTCDEACSKPRNEGCTHKCLQSCHPNECKKCLQRIKLKCHCGINVLYLLCHEWTTADDCKQSNLLSCTNQCPKEMNCKHRCNFPCHSGPCSLQDTCKKKVTIRCSCKRKKKDTQCFLLLGNSDIPCDDECLKLLESTKSKELEIVLKKEAQEKVAQEKEMEEYVKKFEGKKKKKKKSIHYDDDLKWSKNLKIAAALVVCIALIICAFIIKS